MRATALLARTLLSAFYASVAYETNTDSGFLERAEHILDSDEQRRRADAITERTHTLVKLPRISRVTYIGSGHTPDQPSAEQRQARAS